MFIRLRHELTTTVYFKTIKRCALMEHYIFYQFSSIVINKVMLNTIAFKQKYDGQLFVVW